MVTESCGPVDLDVVAKYKLLGGIVADSGSMLPEVMVRLAVTHDELRKVRGQVLRSDKISQCAKLTIVDAILFTKLLFNAGTWINLTQGNLNKLHHAMVSIYRSIIYMVPRKGVKNNTDLEVLDAIERPTMEVMIRVARLRLLPRILVHAPPALLGLLQRQFGVNGSWVQLICDDIQWIRSRLSRFSSFPDPRDDLPYWECYIKSSITRWKSVIRKATYADVQFRVMSNKEKQQVGAPPVADSAVFTCSKCPKTFFTPIALRTHLFSAHGARSIARKYADSGVCRACLKDFHDRRRAAHHIGHVSHRCLAILVSSMDPLTQEQLDDLDDEDRRDYSVKKKGGHGPLHADLPCVQLCGPMIFETTMFMEADGC